MQWVPNSDNGYTTYIYHLWSFSYTRSLDVTYELYFSAKSTSDIIIMGWR